jgi:hypothetical protein
MSRAYKGLEIIVCGKVSERSGGSENVAYLREKLKTMKMADLVRYLVGVARRYEAGELFGTEVRQILGELRGNQPPTIPLTPNKEAAATAASVSVMSKEVQPAGSDVDDQLINDLLESIQGLE